jgi:hypothetical protein
MTPATFMAQLATRAAHLFGRAAWHLTLRQGPTIRDRLASQDPDAGQVDFTPEPMKISMKVPTLD